MDKKLLLISFSILAGAAACTGVERESSLTSPSAGGNNSLMGNWTSSTLIPTPSTCTDFKWNVSEQTGTSARGAFTATCAGNLKLTGTAQGAFTSPAAIAWTADGNATAPGLTSCAIKLTGTASLGTDSVVIPYEGTTCLGPVKGIETLRKR
ncbi:MAG: hypothetical protein M3545_11675 [Acidobacteriota bacterium]|nr:hypothetical protein [Acidobacteriota bacterium]